MGKLCSKCNMTYSNNDIFCPNCGSKLVNISENSSNNVHTRNRQFNKNSTTVSDISTTTKKSRKVLTYIVLIVVILLVCVLAFAIVLNLNTSKGSQNGIIMMSNEDNQRVVYCNGKYYNNIDNSETRYDYNYNSNHTAVGLLDNNKTLWLINNNGKFQVDNDVSTFKISLDGNSVIYTTSAVKKTLPHSDNITYYTGYLKLYDVSTQQTNIVDNDVFISCDDIYGSMLNISSNGDSICYIKDLEYNKKSESIVWDNYIYFDGIASNFADNSVVYNINNDATICYWYDIEKENIYYGNILIDSTSKLMSYDYYDDYIILYFNNDCSECIIGNHEKTYIVDSTKEKENLGSFETLGIYDSSFVDYNDNVVDVDTFNGCILRGYKDDEVKYYYLSKDKSGWKYSEVSNKSVYYDASSDMKYLYGIKNSTSQALHKTNVIDITDETEIALHVDNFKVSKNEKYVYYIDEDETLYCYDGKELTKVDIDVSNIYECNNVFYYIKDVDSNYCGTLYSSYNGKSGERVQNGNDVSDVFACESGVLFISTYNAEKNYLGTLYKVEDKIESIKLDEDIYPY